LGGCGCFAVINKRAQTVQVCSCRGRCRCRCLCLSAVFSATMSRDMWIAELNNRQSAWITIPSLQLVPTEIVKWLLSMAALDGCSPSPSPRIAEESRLSGMLTTTCEAIPHVHTRELISCCCYVVALQAEIASLHPPHRLLSLAPRPNTRLGGAPPNRLGAKCAAAAQQGQINQPANPQLLYARFSLLLKVPVVSFILVTYPAAAKCDRPCPYSF
jgi:hypothetical protein